MLCDLRSNLRCISIDSLTSCDDQVIVDIPESSGDSCRSSPGISTAEYTVSNEDTVISSHSHSFKKNVLCLWKTHGKYCNSSTRMCFLYTKCSLKTSLVIRVHDRKHCCTVKSSVRVKNYAALGIRNLFNTYYNFHVLFAPYLSKFPEITIL